MPPDDLSKLNGNYGVGTDYGYDGNAEITYQITHLAGMEFALHQKTVFYRKGKFEKESTSESKIQLTSFDPETSIAEFEGAGRVNVKTKCILM